MKEEYKDIRSRINSEPIWFDTNGVPRYNPFHPSMAPNVYADECILFEVACQDCHRVFWVERNYSRIHQSTGHTAVDDIRNHELEYGDPPIHGCIGDTMNSVPIRVLQYWNRNAKDGWRKKTGQPDILPKWAEGFKL